jgi:Lar family restriction alleviation protein
MSTQTELLPCPFCGGEPSVGARMDEDLSTHNIVEWKSVRCSNCEIEFEIPDGYDGGTAIEQWNTRAPAQGRQEPDANVEADSIYPDPFASVYSEEESDANGYAAGQREAFVCGAEWARSVAAQCAPQPSGDAAREMRLTAKELRATPGGGCDIIRQAIMWEAKAAELESASGSAVSCAAREALEEAVSWLETIKADTDYPFDGDFTPPEERLIPRLQKVLATLPAAGGEASKREAEISEDELARQWRCKWAAKHISFEDFKAIRASLRKDG